MVTIALQARNTASGDGAGNVIRCCTTDAPRSVSHPYPQHLKLARQCAIWALDENVRVPIDRSLRSVPFWRFREFGAAAPWVAGRLSTDESRYRRSAGNLQQAGP